MRRAKQKIEALQGVLTKALDIDQARLFELREQLRERKAALAQAGLDLRRSCDFSNAAGEPAAFTALQRRNIKIRISAAKEKINALEIEVGAAQQDVRSALIKHLTLDRLIEN